MLAPARSLGSNQKIVVTGASGFVGRQVVPRLLETGVGLLLVGRDPRRLRTQFPAAACCGYEDLAVAGAGHDVLIHLAVLNNDVDADEQAFVDVNVTFTLATARLARQAGIRRFVNVSSVHALPPGESTPYARSKLQAREALERLDGLKVTTLYLPPVYSDVFAGRLSVLKRLPKWLARLLFAPLAALKPTLRAERLAAALAAGLPQEREVVLSDGQEGRLMFRTCKRVVDLTFAATVAALLGWLLAAVWLLIRIESSGPGIFAQERVGRDGRTIVCYKFRTMEQGTAQAGTHEVPASSITRLGAFLRRTKLDELPQIWNILRNDISLVGPRPCLPGQVQLVEARRHRDVFSIKPGITGLAQINGIDMSDPARLALWDARYVALRSLALDLRIMIATATGRGQGDKIRG